MAFKLLVAIFSLVSSTLSSTKTWAWAAHWFVHLSDGLGNGLIICPPIDFIYFFCYLGLLIQGVYEHQY